ncbi:hypothetical protein BDP55DRAFT_687258, partial [Colletotrichum godetiae]
MARRSRLITCVVERSTCISRTRPAAPRVLSRSRHHTFSRFLLRHHTRVTRPCWTDYPPSLL